MIKNIDDKALDVNPSAMLITGRFSQPAGQVFSSIFAPQLAVTYTFSLDPIRADVTLGSKYDVTCHAREKIELCETDYLAHCDAMTAMALRKTYPKEASAHRNMLSRQERNGAVVHADFLDFRSFLRIVGPVPAQGATLDRIDNANPTYGPGLVRWADKQAQNNNKSDTRTIHDAQSNTVYTVSRLAALQGVPANTIRQHLHRGWTDAEIIAGARIKAPSASSAPVTRPEPSAVAYFPRREPESGAAREFRQTAEEYSQARVAGGDEPFIPTYEFLVAEIFKGNAERFTKARYEDKFRSEWPKHRPHLDLDRLATQSPSQVQLIAQIDPEYVRRWNAQKKMVQDLAEHF